MIYLPLYKETEMLQLKESTKRTPFVRSLLACLLRSGRLFGIVKKIERRLWVAGVAMVTGGLDFLKDAAANVSTASYFPGVVMQVFTWNNGKYETRFEMPVVFTF